MWVAAELGCFRSSHSNSLQRSFVLAGPQTALRDDMVQLRVVGIGGHGAIQLGNGLGVHGGAVVTHSQQRTRLKILGSIARTAPSGPALKSPKLNSASPRFNWTSRSFGSMESAFR